MEVLFKTVFVPIASSHFLQATTATFLEEVSAASSAFSVFKLASDILGGTTDGGVFVHFNRILTADLGPVPLIANKRPVLTGYLDCEGAKLGCVAQPVSCHGRQDQQLRLRFVSG
ncbi:hypothetical protein IscW_ISCW018272 [Ixodes scapularis]|uniref:Uncharacterized protein n=1 Tax=Ixodes scapularis TaxID=6945 RepID=B7PEE9_IXOSC|nr:hypothetical protein IscW_ISCW018272 [Ixodes scapularis]|eukprot:XP_002433571.1 hypothetical protein IscW_ISCW018272 [Ixodes scapularis]